MGFIVGLIVNVVLLSVPIGSTLGTLFGIRPFRNEIVPLAPEGKGANNSVLAASLCGDFHEFTQNRIGLNYTINSNEILTEDDSTLCMSLTTFANGTYATNTTAPEFAITWDYPFHMAPKTSPTNKTQPLIHAFPQASFGDGGILPLPLEDLLAMNVEFEWSMGIGNELAPATSPIRLGSQEVNASVALDMYFDADIALASNASAAAFEIIVFFAKYGLQDPVGFGNGSVLTTGKVNGVVYNLFAGKNANDQNVFSWIATEPVTSLKNDISPLFNSILDLRTRKGLKVDIPTFGTNLGYVGFGTQAYNSLGNVTFWAPKLSIDIRKFGS